MELNKAVAQTEPVAQRVRLAMWLALVLIAIVVGVQAWQGMKAEALRSTDLEIIALASGQQTHSQTIARLALQNATDSAQTEMQTVLVDSEGQALRLERLLGDLGVLDAGQTSALPQVVAAWRAAHEQFVASVVQLIKVRQGYEFAEFPRASRALQAQADVYFANSQRLAFQTRLVTDGHNKTFKSQSLDWTLLLFGLLGLLTLGVAEPTARFVRRQYLLLKAQSREMERLALVAASTSNWVVMADTQRMVTWGNEAFLKSVGMTLEQVIGKSMQFFLSPNGNDRDELDRAGEELRQGLSVRVEILALAHDGHGIWLDMDCQPLFDDTGVITGFLAVGNDVTEQVNQRKKLRALFDVLPVGVILYNRAGVVADCNATALQMTSLQMHEFANYESMTMPVSEAHPGRRVVRDDLSDYPMAEQPVARTLVTRRGLRRESVGHFGLGGNGYWTLVNTEPLMDGQGQLSGVVECFMDVSDQKQLEQQLRDMSRTDGLTQLPNRSVVTDQIRAALLRRHAQPGYHFAVLFMDFDRFKQVNDTLGHLVGDQLLRQIAQRLQTSLRPGDAFVRTSDFGQLAARIGGDEFVVLLDDIRGDLDAEVVAGRLLDVLAVPYVIDQHTVNSSVSIGIVTATHAADDVESVLRDADIAMYEAKRTGRGRYVMFEPDMHRRVRDDVTLENDLRSALDRGDLYVVYQPLINLHSSELTGMEALVRWKHPGRGMVSPVEFIPMAEAVGLIVKLGAFVLQTACAAFAHLQARLGPAAPRTVSVNLSRAQLREAGLVVNILDVLRANGMAAHQLQLEITESLAAQDQSVQAKLREIKALGVTLALDDFGTGYSSLSCLAELPIDTVKIDRAFVSVAQTSDYHRVLIEATILVAETLGMKTVAEGIETGAQADIMTALRCTTGQGYLYSPPLERDALVQWIEARRDAM
ncbi:MAG: hypothetical protein RIS34_278 [Pseudomonadota bacterium]